MAFEKLGNSTSREAGWRHWLEVPLVILGALATFALMGLSVSDALLRSFLNAPIFGANDYAQIMLSFIVAISFPLCALSGRLIAIDTLVRKLPRQLQSLTDWVMTIIGICILGYVSWRAFINAREAALFGETTLLLQLPFGPSYYAVSIGCGLSALVLLAERFGR
ncbi:TRAP transporter small permease [Roseibium sediminis]|uniref:TRAP transporter small permease n=1 Tax=Roseibium sediminis TaxID=1775174 RepID=UPI00123DDD1A|nr:TRAP transporter small permease [Roseibium sediminis]